MAFLPGIYIKNRCHEAGQRFKQFLGGSSEEGAPLDYDPRKFVELIHASGEKRWNVLFVSGIMNGVDDVTKSVEVLKERSGCPQIAQFLDRVYASDSEDRLMKKEVVCLLSEQISAFLAQGALCIIAHSHGAELTLSALEKLRQEHRIDQQEQDSLEVYTYGGVAAIPEDYAGSVGNSINGDDHVRKLGKAINLKRVRVAAEEEKRYTEETGHQFIEGYVEAAALEVRNFVQKHSQQ